MRNFSYHLDVCTEKYCYTHWLERSLMFRARADIASWTTPVGEPRKKKSGSMLFLILQMKFIVPTALVFFIPESGISYPRSETREKPASFQTEIVNPRSLIFRASTVTPLRRKREIPNRKLVEKVNQTGCLEGKFNPTFLSLRSTLKSMKK